MKLLIVDDQQSVHRMLEHCLNIKKLGITSLLHAENGKEALGLVERENPELILLDIVMPEMDGLKVTEYLRGQKSSRIIMLSAYPTFEYARTAMKNNVRDYLLKPIDIDEVHRVLAENIMSLKRENEAQNDVPSEANPPENSSKTDSQIVEDIHQYVSIHYDQELTLEAISSQFFINKFQLIRMFKKKYGVTYQEYVIGVRMEKAAKLITTSERMLYEIAQSVGYNDASYFSMAFKKHYGVTPNQYRTHRGHVMP